MNSAENPGKITLAQVQHVAHLARLEIPADALPKLAKQLESILEYVAQINQPIDRVDVSTVEPMARPQPMKNVLREDCTEPALPIDKVFQNAPQTDGQFFMVPKVVGGDEDSAG